MSTDNVDRQCRSRVGTPDTRSDIALTSKIKQSQNHLTNHSALNAAYKTYSLFVAKLYIQS